MDKFDSFFHDLEHYYYDFKHWMQNVNKVDFLIGRILPAAIVFLLVLYLIRTFCAGGTCKNKARMDGKTVIVTGANGGIGFEAAREFYKRGARVIMACRNMKKAEKAASNIRQCYKNEMDTKLGEIVIYTLDLSSMTSIREFANDIIEKEDSIDILVNNAGLVQARSATQQLTEDGFDLTMGTNHLGPFLLTNLLLKKLSMAQHKPARIVNVASVAYEWGKLHLEDLNFGALPYPGSFPAYGQSKLANILFTRVLALKTKDMGIVTYVLHPGTVNTNIAFNFVESVPLLAWIMLKCLWPLFLLFAKTPKEGAQTIIYCAVEDSIANESGHYYLDCKKGSLKAIGRDDDTAEKLWDLSEKLVKLKE